MAATPRSTPSSPHAVVASSARGTGMGMVVVFTFILPQGGKKNGKTAMLAAVVLSAVEIVVEHAQVLIFDKEVPAWNANLFVMKARLASSAAVTAGNSALARLAVVASGWDRVWVLSANARQCGLILIEGLGPQPGLPESPSALSLLAPLDGVLVAARFWTTPSPPLITQQKLYDLKLAPQSSLMSDILGSDEGKAEPRAWQHRHQVGPEPTQAGG